jgi:polysaccharide deacetylase family protein (PEP-CTERM system associated)
VDRQLGLEAWDRRSPAFERQMNEVLALLDELGVHATFFVLGICARRYPELVVEAAARGHEIACHGFAHERVFEQTPSEFRNDLLAATELIEGLVRRRPRGYRAPAFSITRATLWAYDVLADEGFAYDSSQYDSPRVPARIGSIPQEPYRLALASGHELLELPIATARVAGRTVPLGGGSYWRMLPRPLLRRALRRVSPEAVVYLHPYELDPNPLRSTLPPRPTLATRVRAFRQDSYWNSGRRSVSAKLRQVANDFRLVSCEEYIRESRARERARPYTLSQEGVLV